MLIDAVNKTIDSIENLIKTDEVLQNIQKNIKLALPLLRKELFMDIINGKNNDIQNIGLKFKQYDIELSTDKPVLLLCATIDESPNNNSNSSVSAQVYSSSIGLAVDSVLNEHLKHTHRSYYLILDDSTILWFIQQKRSDSYELENRNNFEYIYSFLDIIQDSCSRILNTRVSFILADNECQWDEVHHKFNLIKRTVRRTRRLNETIVIAEKLPAYSNSSSFDNPLEKILEQTKKALLSGDQSKFKAALNLLKSDIKKIDPA